MNKFLTIIMLLGSAMMLQAAKTDEKVTISVEGDSREYWLYVPDNVKENAPLVLSLHGAGGQCMHKSPFRTDVADKEGCIVAYPQGKITTFPGLGGMQTFGWSANQNVYRSLQFRTGSYKLCFQSKGKKSLSIGVKIQKLTDQKNTVLETNVKAGKAVELPFDITDGWGEYEITFTRPTATDDITISNIAVYSRTE